MWQDKLLVRDWPESTPPKLGFHQDHIPIKNSIGGWLAVRCPKIPGIHQVTIAVANLKKQLVCFHCGAVLRHADEW